jgi:hypothetical protein
MRCGQTPLFSSFSCLLSEYHGLWILDSTPYRVESGPTRSSLLKRDLKIELDLKAAYGVWAPNPLGYWGRADLRGYRRRISVFLTLFIMASPFNHKSQLSNQHVLSITQLARFFFVESICIFVDGNHHESAVLCPCICLQRTLVSDEP